MGELLFCFSLNKLAKGVQQCAQFQVTSMGCVCAGWRGAERSVANGWGSPVWESESRLDLFIPHQLCPALPSCPGCEVSVSRTRGLSHLTSPIQTLPQPGNLGSCIQSKPSIPLFRHCNGNAFCIYLFNSNYFYNYLQDII